MGRRSLWTKTSASPAKQIVFSGIQPTGVPHLGNYLGALRNWVRLQHTLDKDATIFFSIVDLHAITVPIDPEKLRSERNEMWYSLYAAGIDMQRCIVFEQSAVLLRSPRWLTGQVPEHTELYWILGTLAPMGLLNSMTQWKVRSHSAGLMKAKLEQAQSKGLVPRPKANEISSDFGGSRLGLFAYPVLQAADILLYKFSPYLFEIELTGSATHVPVGEDQSQHLETTRIIARNFNNTFPSSPSTFNIPQTLISIPRLKE